MKFALALAAVLLTSPAWAASECPRGSLDRKYCDSDGDLLADPPADGKFIDPSTLIFAYTPVEDPSLYTDVWQSFLAHLSKVTGKKVTLFQVQSNAAQLEALRSGRLHVAGVNTGGVPIAVNCTGFVPFSIMGGPTGPFGYEMEIIVPAASPIKTPADLKGRTVAFSAPTSNSGFKAPTVILKQDFGLEANKDYKTTFSGKHDTSVQGVANGDYEAAAIANEVIQQMVVRKAVDTSKFRSIYKSQTFPTTGYGYLHSLKPELVAKIKEAFFTFPFKDSTLQEKAFPHLDRFQALSYAKDWDFVRKIDAASGVSYDCK